LAQFFSVGQIQHRSRDGQLVTRRKRERISNHECPMTNDEVKTKNKRGRKVDYDGDGGKQAYITSRPLRVLSDIGAYRSFVEIAPDAPKDYALFFNPYDTSELARILDAAFDNPVNFEHIPNNGLEVASHYTPENTKEYLRQALEETLCRHST